MELDEAKIRKQWLIMFWVSVIVGSIIMLTVNLGYIDIMPSLPPEMAEYQSFVTIGLLLSSLMGIFFWWVWYHCAYKKRGYQHSDFALMHSRYLLAKPHQRVHRRPKQGVDFDPNWPKEF